MDHVAITIAYEALYQRYKHALPMHMRQRMRRSMFVFKGLASHQLRIYYYSEALLAA